MQIGVATRLSKTHILIIGPASDIACDGLRFRSILTVVFQRPKYTHFESITLSRNCWHARLASVAFRRMCRRSSLEANPFDRAEQSVPTIRSGLIAFDDLPSDPDPKAFFPHSHAMPRSIKPHRPSSHTLDIPALAHDLKAEQSHRAKRSALSERKVFAASFR